MIDPTHSEVVILRSVKKFFVDNFPSYPLFFEPVTRQPATGATPEPFWLCILPSGRVNDALSSADIQINIFVESAADGIASAEIRDNVLSKLMDLTQTDGCQRMVCYDAAWSPLYTARISILGDADYTAYMDGLGLRIISFRLHWGAK